MSKPNIYALFIGINQYDNASISNLSGCVQDAESVANWLHKKIDTEKYGLSILKLYSDKNTHTPLPTRKNILMALQSYVGKLKKEDTFLLFYAGHGSTEIALPALQSTTGMLSTLVPCDSGIRDNMQRPVFDITSLEIRHALYQIWKDTCPKIVFIQDSCHSERATRAYGEINPHLSTTAQARFVAKSPNMGISRHINEFEVSEQARNYLAQGRNPMTPQANLMPMAEHVHIAACAFDQYAYEDKNEDGSTSGIFTRTLLEVLNLSNGNLSYKELVSRLNLSIDGVFKQSPNIYVPENRKDLLYNQFLDANAFKKEQVYNLVIHKKDVTPSLLLDVGALQGLPILKENQTLDISIINREGDKVLNGKINYVAPTFSELEVSEIEKKAILEANCLWYVVVPSTHFYSEIKPLATFIESVAEIDKTDLLIENLVQNLPDVFIRAKDNVSYYLALDEAEHCIHIYQKYQSQYLLRASFAAIEIAEELYAAQKLPNRATWQYYDLNDNLCELKQKAVFVPLNENFEEGTAAAIFAFELFEKKYPIRIASLPAISFNNYVPNEINTQLYPFINWVGKAQEAQYIISAKNGAYYLYRGQHLVYQTIGQSKMHALEIIDALRTIANFQKVLLMQNPHPKRLIAFDRMEFKLQVQLNGINHSIQLDLGKPITTPIQISMHAHQPIQLTYALMAAYNYTGSLSTSNMPSIYMSALWMGADYSIVPIAHATAFKIDKDKFLPLGMMQNWQALALKSGEKRLNNIKILVALKPFDTTNLWQEGLSLKQSESQRSTLRKYGNNASDWLAFSIPIELLAHG